MLTLTVQLIIAKLYTFEAKKKEKRTLGNAFNTHFGHSTQAAGQRKVPESW